MNFFCDSGGNIFHVDIESVYQGSANANTVYFIGAFPNTCTVKAQFLLPNGVYTEPQILTKATQADLQDMQTKTGNTFNVWYYKLNKVITQYYGAVSLQFSVYDSQTIKATANSSFEVLRGVPVEISEPNDFKTFAEQVMQYIASVDTIVQNYDEKIGKYDEELSGAITDLKQARQEIENALEGLSGYVKKTDYATATTAGVVRVYPDGRYGVGFNDAAGLFVVSATNPQIAGKANANIAITPSVLDYAVKVGVTTNIIDLSDDEKADACEWIGAVKKINVTQPFLYGYSGDTWGLGVNAATIANTPQNTGVHTIPWYYPVDEVGLDNVTEWNKFSLFTHTPVRDYACANKKYVDDAVSNAGGKLYLHKIAFRFKDSTKEYSITHKCYSTKSTAFTAAEWLEFLGARGLGFAMEPCVLYDGDIATMVGTYRMTMLLRVLTGYDTIPENDAISVYLWDNGIDHPDEYNVTFTGFTDTLKEI